jgi:hypothetical protein
MFCNFNLIKNGKIADTSTTAEGKMSIVDNNALAETAKH